MSWDSWDALGSILGGIFGGFAFLATLVLLVRESRTRREDKEDERARQARLIVSRITDESYSLDGSRTLHLQGTVWNYSDMPIFNLIVNLEGAGTGRDGFRMVQPGESVTAELVVALKNDGKPVDMGLPRKMGLVLHFLDGNGRHWRRQGAGQPGRVLRDALSEKVPVERFNPETLRPEPASDAIDDSGAGG